MKFELVQRIIQTVTDPKFRFFRFNDINPLSGTMKVRKIGAPNTSMRLIHAWFTWYLRSIDLPMPSATGGIPRSSPKKNLNRHRVGENPREDGYWPFKQHFYLIDLSSAYHSLDHSTIVELITRIVPEEEREEVEDFLRKYCFDYDDGGLITGAPASPQIFNMCLELLGDRKIREWCLNRKIGYTRYIDDFAFSSREPIGCKKRRAIRQMLIDAGLRINHKKCQIVDLAKGPVNINGVGVRQNGEIYLPRHAFRRFRGMVHLALTFGNVDYNRLCGYAGMFLNTLGLELNRAEVKVFHDYMEVRRRLRSMRDEEKK